MDYKRIRLQFHSMNVFESDDESRKKERKSLCEALGSRICLMVCRILNSIYCFSFLKTLSATYLRNTLFQAIKAFETRFAFVRKLTESLHYAMEMEIHALWMNL